MSEMPEPLQMVYEKLGRYEEDNKSEHQAIKLEI